MHEDIPAVRRFSDKEVASRYFEKSISGMRNVESDFTSYDKECVCISSILIKCRSIRLAWARVASLRLEIPFETCPRWIGMAACLTNNISQSRVIPDSRDSK